MLQGILSSPEETFKRHKKQLGLTPAIIYAFENLTSWTFQNTVIAEVVIFYREKKILNLSEPFFPTEKRIFLPIAFYFNECLLQVAWLFLFYFMKYKILIASWEVKKNNRAPPRCSERHGDGFFCINTIQFFL